LNNTYVKGCNTFCALSGVSAQPADDDVHGVPAPLHNVRRAGNDSKMCKGDLLAPSERLDAVERHKRAAAGRVMPQ